jgi:NitT/TauT family transport system substrate-binding protein
MKARLMTGAAALAAVAVLAGCSSGGSSGSGGPANQGGSSGGLTTVTVGTSGTTAAYGPIYVGAQQGIFKKHGIDLKIQDLTPNSVTAAVLSGNIDVAMDGPNLAAGILSNPSAKVAATAGPTVFYIYAHQGIKSVAALKGDTIAVTTPGGALDTSVRAAITKAGLRPGIDVKIAYLQTNSAALAAAETGSVQAAGVSPPTSVEAQQAGLVQLENITPLCPLSLVAVNSQFAAGNKAVLRQFMAAWKEANALAASSEADSAAGLKQYVQITNQAQLQGSWEAYKSVWEAVPFPASAMKQVLDQLAAANPPVKAAATANPASLIDNSFMSAATS